MLAGEEALSEDENTALRIYPGDFKETSFEGA